jgi:hypothetical protein
VARYEATIQALNQRLACNDNDNGNGGNSSGMGPGSQPELQDVQPDSSEQMAAVCSGVSALAVQPHAGEIAAAQDAQGLPELERLRELVQLQQSRIQQLEDDLQDALGA